MTVRDDRSRRGSPHPGTCSCLPGTCSCAGARAGAQPELWLGSPRTGVSLSRPVQLIGNRVPHAVYQPSEPAEPGLVQQLVHL